MPASAKLKHKRRGGVLRETSRMTRIVTAFVLAALCATLAFTQLGFFGLGINGEYSAYLIVELVPIAVTALLLGTVAGMCMGVFAGVMLLAHVVYMPLNFYEFTFVTPLSSVFMLGITGLLLGGLFRFVLRHDPFPVKAAIYITLVCIIVSWLYSLGFLANTMISVALDIASNHTSGSVEQVSKILEDRFLRIALRMGKLDLQAWADAILMSLFCIASTTVFAKAKRIANNKGLRSMFAVRLSVVVFVAFMVTSVLSFVSLSQGEIAEAERDMENQVNYLWHQIENSNRDSDESIAILLNPEKNLALSGEKLVTLIGSSPIKDLLDGYSPDNKSSIFLLREVEKNEEKDSLDDNPEQMILLSDNDSIELGSTVDETAGREISDAVRESAESESVKRAVYDADYGYEYEEATQGGDGTIHSQIVYVFAKRKGSSIIAIMTPTSKVFAGRSGIMGWIVFSVFVLLVAVFAMVFLLLDRVVVRRIDETNSTLACITAGDLDAKVEVCDTREFASLSDGINDTVTALKGWIVKAESRIDSELATAKAIQTSALPCVFPPFPDIHKFDIYASMQAAREVGGDFYDFFLIGDECNAEKGKLGFVIADVSGKGVPAALFMMKAMTQLRDYLKVGMEVGEAVENANRQLCEGNHESMFVTVWAGVLDYATNQVSFVNAGHNPPLFWQHSSGWRWLSEKSGLPLGLFDGLPYEAYSLECDIGEQFLLYTDGVTEAMNIADELYSENRLQAFAEAHYAMHPRRMVNALRHDIAQWAQGAEQSDDITILVLEVGVPPELTAMLSVPASVDELEHVNSFIHSELDRRLCPKRVQNLLDIAVEELFVNVCRYAYPDATPDNPGIVRILRTYSAEPLSVIVEIIDEGIPYNPLEKPDLIIPDNIEEVPIGGLGILMAKNCTDEMRYERTDGNNILTIVKKW